MTSVDICNITRDTKHVRIIARVARAWDFHSPNNPDVIFSFEFLLIDYKGDTIQGIVNSGIASKFRELLVEGEVYAISGFSVVPAQASYRTSPHAFRIMLQPNAIVRPIDDLTTPTIPFDKFNFMSFDDLKGRVGQFNILSDTIGQLVVLEGVEQTRFSDNIKTKRSIIIQNSRKEQMCVTLWEKAARDFPEAHIIECAKEGPIILVLTSVAVKAHYVSGEPVLAATAASKFFVNPELPEVESFVESLPIQPAELQVITNEKAPLPDPKTEISENRKTVFELLQLDFHTDKDTRYTCEAVIKEIDSTEGWWYRACPRCKSGIQTYDQNNYCKKCGLLADMPLPWYRVTAIVEDVTGEVPVILFGNMAAKLIGLPAFTLSTMSKDKYDVPPLLKKICGLRHVFQLQMSDRVQDCSQMLFKVVQVFKEAEINKDNSLISPPLSYSESLVRTRLSPATPAKVRRSLQFTDEDTASSSQGSKKQKID